MPQAAAAVATACLILEPDYDCYGGAKTAIGDAMPDMGDSIQVSSSSPSEPTGDVALLNGSHPADQTFIDVEANCAIDGAETRSPCLRFDLTPKCHQHWERSPTW